MKIVELTDQSSERQPDNNDFIRPSVHGDSIYTENLTISAFWIYVSCTLWIHLAMPSHARPNPVDLWLTCTKSIFITQLIIGILEFQESSTI